jgi:aarF domain-containing kinase
MATLRCFWEYKKVLGVAYADDDAKYKALSQCHLKCAKMTLRALEKNGGIYIKLGQHIGAMTYLLPDEWTTTMISLQDRCPVSRIDEIDAMFKHDLGKGIVELFEEFSEKPAGAASLAQVHVAKLKTTGEKVAVKCQHPSLREFVPLDVFLTQTVFQLLDKVFPEYPLVWLGDELQSSIYVELDFTNETRNARRTAEYFKEYTALTALRIPSIYTSSPRILVMEYLPGSRLDDLNYLKTNKIDRSEVSASLAHIFNNMIFTPGVGIHCDPHGGNLAIRSCKPSGQNPHNYEIILYDHGLYRDVSIEMRRHYARFWLALITRDAKEMEYHATRFASITPEQFPVFAAAITGRDIATALDYDISRTRDEAEIANMKSALTSQGLLVDLMSILSSMPRVVLLILKTNDLVRHLDEVLQNPQPERVFLILAQYCANTVYDEDVETIKAREVQSQHRGFIQGLLGKLVGTYERIGALAKWYNWWWGLKGYELKLWFRTHI